jgi:hypothetical protein
VGRVSGHQEPKLLSQTLKRFYTDCWNLKLELKVESLWLLSFTEKTLMARLNLSVWLGL